MVTSHHRISSAPIVDPSRLQPAGRWALGDALYECHREIFDGVDREQFQRYVVDSQAERSVIQTYVSDHLQVVGYTALHFHERVLGGRPATIVRSEIGLQEGYRGRSLPVWFIVRELCAFLLAHPQRAAYVLGCPINPAMYFTMSRFAPEVWPCWQRETPPAERALMMTLAGEFGLAQVDPERPLVRRVGWRIRESERERRFWRRHRDPHVQFYLRQNPDYRTGLGMLLLAPITWSNLGRGALGVARRQLQRRRQAITESGTSLFLSARERWAAIR